MWRLIDYFLAWLVTSLGIVFIFLIAEPILADLVLAVVGHYPLEISADFILRIAALGFVTVVILKGNLGFLSQK